MATKVKGIKYGTLAQYKAFQTKDPDTLYFIIDKGLIFRGESIVIPRSVIGATVSGEGSAQVAQFTIETYTAGQTGDNLPQTLTFSVSTQAAVNAVISIIEQSLGTHRIVGGSGTEQDPYVYADGKATGSQSGHVILTDTVDMAMPANNATAASGGTAVTPKGVYDAINAILPGLAGAMLFKGTIGAAAAYSTTATYAVGDYCEHGNNLYRCNTAIGTGGETWTAAHWIQVSRTVSTLPSTHTVGWTYRVVAPGTYAGKTCEVGDLVICVTSGTATNNDHWTVAQNNIDGAVTAQNDLPKGNLVLGNNGKTVKTLPNGSGNHGKYIRQNLTGDIEWMRHAIHYAKCTTQSGILTKIAATADNGERLKVLVSGTLAAVHFTTDVEHDESSSTPSPITLNIDDTGAHIVLHKSDNPILTYTIYAGDTALFIYDESDIRIKDIVYRGAWRLIAVDHRLAEVAFSGSYANLSDTPANLSDFNNDLTAYGVCTTAAGTTQKNVVILSPSSFAKTEGAVLVVKFANAVSTTAKLKIQGDNNSAGVVINDFVGYANGNTLCDAGDVCTFIYGKTAASADSLAWNLVGIHRHIDTEVTAGSTNLVTSGAVAAAIANATCTAINKRNFYGVCNTAASTASKQAIGVTAFELNTGAIVTVKFTNAVTASGATLSLSSDSGVNFTDAKYIYYNGQPLPADVIEAGDICTFMYNGAQFNLIAFAREGLKWDSLPEVIV